MSEVQDYPIFTVAQVVVSTILQKGNFSTTIA